MPFWTLRTRTLVLRTAFASLLLTPTALLSQTSVPPQGSDLTGDQSEARDALNHGVEAFKNAQFDEAIQLFKHAKELDPSVQNASLYLATAYASQYIPGAPSDDNREKGEMAVREYKEALAQDPSNLPAIDGLASILYQMAGQPFNPALFEESKSYHKKHIELRPNDPQPYYAVGVIDWALAYRANSELRRAFNESVGVRPETTSDGKDTDDANGGNESDIEVGLKDTDPLPEVIRRKYAEDFGPTIDEGIAALKHAIQLNPDYDDAMVYLNLMYRRQADVVASAAEREEWTRMADELLDRVRDIKQKKAETSP